VLGIINITPATLQYDFIQST